MKTTTLVEVWDHRQYWAGGRATVGVNWHAVGPVMPATARRFANQILRAADKAEAQRAKLKAKGYELDNPEND